MSRKFSLLTALATSAISVTTTWHQPSQAQDIAFVCTVTTDNIPTTIAQTPEGPVDVFKWQSTYFRPPYTPMQRCQEVTERMNNFQAQGMLEYLTSGRVNRQPVICAGSSCDTNGSNVLLTLRSDQNSNQVLQEIAANRAGAAGPSRQLSGGSSHSASSGVLRQNADGTITLNLNKYLGATSPGATKPQNNSQGSPIFQPDRVTPPNAGSSPSRVW